MNRLADAAAHFWPTYPPDEREERVHETLAELLKREARGETHKISWWAKWMFVRTHEYAMRKGIEIASDDIVEIAGIVEATQIDAIFARESIALIRYLPMPHREIMELMVDGADPLEISDEMRTPIITVIRIIREARTWLEDGGCYLDLSAGDRRVV